MHERDLFIAALEIDDQTARCEYLEAACAGDPAKRVRVERLLNRAGEAGDFLEHAAADLCSDWDPEILTQAIDPPPITSDSPSVIRQADDTAQTIVETIPPARDSHLVAPLPHATTEASSILGTLFGRYRIERVLGSGGMGVVYLAEDLRLGRRVALKIPKFDADGKLNLSERFRREARTMASVLHRNLCPVFDVDEQDGTHYLTMAFIEGESLSQVIKREQSADGGSRETANRTLTNSATKIADLIRKLALALEEAHRAGVVHRDLKPANVMFDRSGEPILMDFGLAWMVHETDSRVTQSGAIIGTPAYMSPEQAEGDPSKVGAASDIYSLGAILYELLAGRPIHTGGVTRVLFKLIHESPNRPSEVCGNVDPNLEAICWKAISKRPKDRFATAAKLAEALARFIEGRPWEDVLSRSVSEGERSTEQLIPSLVKRPPSHTLRVGESDRTEVLPPDTSAETIAYHGSGELARDGSRGKSRIVLASLLLIGVFGVGWAIVANRTDPSLPKNITQPPTTPVSPDINPDDKQKQTAEVGPPSANAPFGPQQALALQQAWAKHLRVPEEYENSVGIKFRLLPPGEFLMGTDRDEVEERVKSANEYWASVFRSETAQHTVRLTHPLYLGVYEVTQQQFQQVMSRNPSAYSASGRFAAAVAGLDTSQHPVDSMTWFEAIEFCNQLSQSEGLPPYYSSEADVVTSVGGPGYRLPSEAEWEFACRAGTYGRWAWGDEPDRAADFGWYKDNPSFTQRTIPIGTKAANPFGLHDLHGNISEWCQDWQAPYSADAVENPVGPRHGGEKIFRGGSWNDVVWFGRAALRLRSPPAHAHSFLGLRVAFGGDGEFPKSLTQVARVPPKNATPTTPQPDEPQTPIVLNPADSGLTIHDPQWKLIEVIRPEGRVFSTRFDREGRLYFAMPDRLDDKSSPPGLYRVQPDGTFQPLVQAADWEFVFTPDEQRCFTHRGTMGMIAEVDLKTGMSIREVDMSPSDDGPTSPYFAPAWYRGLLVRPNEYLFADFGTTKRKPPSTGGIWKFGSGMAAPERLLTMPEGGSVVHALAFGRDQLFVATVKGNSGSLMTFDGRQLVEHPTETLPSIGNMVFDPSDGSLIASEFNGQAILRIDLSRPDQPASVKPILSGFRKLNFGVMSLTQDGRRLAVVDFESNRFYVFSRSARGAQAVPIKQVLAAPIKLELAEQLPSVASATGLKLGDLDGDGDLDLFVAMLKAPCVMLRNNGRGHFTDSGQQLGDNASFAVALGDLDGDGDLDAFVCNSDEQEDTIWLNDGRGTFQRSPQVFPPSFSNDVVLADVDGDKDLDIAVSSFNGPVKIWINGGAGRFTEQQSFSRISNTGVALGDVDGDGDADLVLSSFGGDNRVWFNNGRGHFIDSEQNLELAESTSVTLGDLDLDGDLDLFITGHQGSKVWFNDGRGRFQASEQLLGDGKCEAVELVDLDADHDLDAVTIAGGWNPSQPRIIWVNDGKGRFHKGPALGSGNTQSLAIGDLDGDGDADIVLGNLSQPAEVWLNQSNQSTIP